MGVLRVERSVRSGSSQSRYSQSRSSQANPAGERLRLEIAGLSSDGSGIARTDRGVVFVAGALPGELVEAEPADAELLVAFEWLVDLMGVIGGVTDDEQANSAVFYICYIKKISCQRYRFVHAKE